jgi:hypothetical protein
LEYRSPLSRDGGDEECAVHSRNLVHA